LTDAVTGQPLVTFSRASSATFVGSDGLVQTASTDVPRFDHNPITGESLGLLVEEARTNLLVRSDEFDNASWTKFRGSTTANASTAPNGILSAEKFVEDATASNTHGLFAAITIVTATAYTYSVYMKAAERSWVVLGLDIGAGEKKTWFNLSTGAIGTNANTTATISPAGNGWYRCIVTSTSAATSATCALKLATNDNVESYNGDNTSGLFLWGAQLEAGAFATSYIPTTTAAVTRAADVTSITGTAFSSWYRQDEGTVFARVVPNGIASQNYLMALPSGTTFSNSHLLYAVNGALRGETFVGGAQQSNVGIGSIAVGQKQSAAYGYKLNDFAAARNGALGTPDTSGSLPSPDRLMIGCDFGSGQQLSGTIERLTFWPRRLDNSTLQSLTQ
jgi:hypothetical protein